MSEIIKKDDGTEVEVFTAEEVAAKSKEEADKALADAQTRADEEKAAALAEKETELATAKEELEKLQKKDMNFENLRKGTENKGKEAEGLAKTVETLSRQIEEINRRPIEEARAAFVATNIGTDKVLGDKFDVYFKKLGADAKTKAEAEAAMSQAFVLASDGRKPDMGTRMTQASVDDDFSGTGTRAESEASKEFAAKMGNTAEDKKTYGPGAKLDLIKPNIKVRK